MWSSEDAAAEAQRDQESHRALLNPVGKTMKSMIAGAALIVLCCLPRQSFGQQYGVATPIPVPQSSYRSRSGGYSAYTSPYGQPMYAPYGQAGYGAYGYSQPVPQNSYYGTDPRFPQSYEPTSQPYPAPYMQGGGFFDRLMELERRKNQWLFGRPSLFY